MSKRIITSGNKSALIEDLGHGKFRSKALGGLATDKFDGIKLKYVLIPKTVELEEFYKIIIGDRFAKKDRVFVIYNDYQQAKVCASLQTVMKYSKWASHHIPNTFYKWNSRSKENLRCIRWMTFDFELRKSNGDAFIPAEVYEIFGQTTGFYPTFVVRSKTPGNYHVYLEHTSLNGSTTSVYLYERVQKEIQSCIGTDEGANGANHNFRIPRKDIYYFGPNIIDFNDLKAWFITRESEKKKEQINRLGNVASLTEKQVFDDEAIKKLLNAEFDGSRNHAGFTIALLCYVFGKSKEETRSLMHEWFLKVQQIPGKPYRVTELRASIKSAYSGKYYGPSREYIEALTGCEFKYKIYKSVYIKTERHNKNENDAAIINFLRENNGKWVGTQKDLLERVSETQTSSLGKTFSSASLKRNLRRLRDDGTITWDSLGSGGDPKKKEVEFVLNDGIRSIEKTVIEHNNDLIIDGQVIAV